MEIKALAPEPPPDELPPEELPPDELPPEELPDPPVAAPPVDRRTLSPVSGFSTLSYFYQIKESRI